MKFTVASIAALVALVQAIEITNEVLNPVAGEPFEITWQGAEGPVTLILRRGDRGNLDVVTEIASGLDGDSGSYTWDVPTTFETGDDYAFQIEDSEGDNYSVQFPLEGTGEAETDSATSAAETTTVTSTEPTSTEATTITTVTSSEASSSAESTSAEASSTESESASPTESDEPESTEDAPDSKAGRLGSPVALIFTLAAMFYFH